MLTCYRCCSSSPPPAKPRHAPKAEESNIVGVFGLSIRTVERDLEEEFTRVAPVEKVVIVYDARVSTESATKRIYAAHRLTCPPFALGPSQTERSRGFGFVTMKDVEGAHAVITALNGIVSRETGLTTRIYAAC